MDILDRTAEQAAKKTQLELAVFDDFNRADTNEPDLGGPPLGGRWLLGNSSGNVPGTRGCIRSGKMVSLLVGFAGGFFAIQPWGLGQKPLIIVGKPYWCAGGGTGGPGELAMGCSLSLTPNVTYNRVTVRLSPSALYIDGNLNGTWTSYKSVTISPALSLGVTHSVEAHLDPETGLVEAYVNGVLKASHTHNKLKAAMGEYVWWQIRYPGTNSTTEVRVDEVDVWTPPGWRNATVETKQPRFYV